MISCVNISTISKWTETNLHLILLTSEHHWVRPKRFLSLWYIWRQPCSYLIWTQTVSKWTETRFHMTTSPRSSIGCIQNDFRAYGTVDANGAPILRQDYLYLQMDQNEHSLEPRLLVVPSGVSKTISDPTVRLAQTMHLSRTDTNTVSKQKETRCQMVHAT